MDDLHNFSLILDSLSDGVYVCDSQRRIVYWNKSAERITGWRAEEVVGRYCLDDVLAHVDKDGHRLCGEEHCPLHRSMVTGATTDVPIIVFARGKDGRRIPSQVTASPIHNAAGQIVGGVETFRDVSTTFADLRRARKIQARNLRLDLPNDPRLRISTFLMQHDIVGGDYCAVKQLDEDKYGFLLADMAGHGLAAALYTMHLSILTERFYQLMIDPTEFAAALNNELVPIFDSDSSFAAAICGVIDARAGILRLTGAGGPLPLIIHADWSVEKLKRSGLPLGVTEDFPYEEETIELEPGDSILSFSDGAFEIHNDKNEMLGIDGLMQILKKHDYPQTELRMDVLEEELLKFSNDIRLQDDLTIIEFRFLRQNDSG